MNQIVRICERVDADATLVAEGMGMGMDKRIGSAYLDAGISERQLPVGCEARTLRQCGR